MDYPGSIVAQTGWTTRNLLNGISTAAPNLQPPYDLVTLLIGVNNQYQRRDTNEYKIEFVECLNKAIAYSGNRPQRVFVLSIPDYGVTPFGMANAAQIALEIDRFNRINKEICINNGIDYTDITTSTRLAANDPDLICSDSLHPSGIEYEKWAELLAPKMIPLLR
jgi:lysophospholipase L1-like esterase